MRLSLIRGDIRALARRERHPDPGLRGHRSDRNLVGADVLAALGPDGILVNIARGSVVDEGALLDALEDGRLGGGALDVFANEPDLDPRFRSLESVILSPHAASFTVEARQAVIGHLLAEARRFFSVPQG